MAVEHKDIVDAQRHEPKGISTAVANTAYVANGAASGSWRKIKSTDLEGLTGDGGNTRHSVGTDGSNGFILIPDAAFGSMVITNNAVNFPVTAVTDTTFGTPSQFSLFTGAGAPWASDNLNDITFNTDKLTVPVTGIYKVEAYINIAAFPSSSARISISYRISGGAYSARRPVIKSSGVGAEGQLIGFGLTALTATDYIQLYVASDATGNLLIKNANVLVDLVKAT